MNDIPHSQERKTCMPCRKRKVKCDGRAPKCGPCSLAKRELVCIFPLRPENRDKRNALPKGKACLSCRSKKKKCDGFRPTCSTCSRSRDGQPCTYDEGISASNGNSEAEPDDESPIPTPHNLDGPTRRGRSDSIQLPLRLDPPSSSDSEGVRSPPLSAPSTPSPRPLPLLHAVDECQWNYFRSLALSNSLRLGISFTHLKEDSIRQGDLTGRTAHPWFTWFMAVMGVHLHQESRHEWQELRIQRTITQMLLRMLLKMRETGPSFDIFQAWYLMAMFYTYTHTIIPAQRYLLRCKELIESEGFRFVEPTGADVSTRSSPSATAIDDRQPEYNDKKHELVSVLVNLIYLQCIHCMLYDACHGMYADLEAQLPDFARAYPQSFNLSWSVLRARTIILVRDMFLHLKLLETEGLSQREWLSDAVNLLARLDTIFQVLDSAVDQLNDQGTLLSVETHEERQTYLLVSSCKLFGITAQARIYMETSKLPILPKSQVIKFRTLAMDSIQSFLTIHETFNQEGDLRYLDYFVISCWDHIRNLYLVLYPDGLDSYPLTEISRQITLLEGALRVTPAGRGVSVLHSMVGLGDENLSPDEPDFLKEDERLKWGL